MLEVPEAPPEGQKEVSSWSLDSSPLPATFDFILHFKIVGKKWLVNQKGGLNSYLLIFEVYQIELD